EILANNALEDQFMQARRIARPMYAVDIRCFEPGFLEENEGRIPFIPDGMLPLRAQPNTPGGEVFSTVSPKQETLGASSLMFNQSEEQIRGFTGVAPQMEGKSGGAESATEASQQGSYLEQEIGRASCRERVEGAGG